jgi:hypothetical protein
MDQDEKNLKVEEKLELSNESSLKNNKQISTDTPGTSFEILENNFDFELSKMESYEEWCKKLDQSSETSDSDSEFNFLFQNNPEDADDEDSGSDVDEEYQKNLCKEYRKFIQNKINNE